MKAIRGLNGENRVPFGAPLQGVYKRSCKGSIRVLLYIGALTRPRFETSSKSVGIGLVLYKP